MDHLYALIMAGGSGTRFWPASRRLRPKQLLPIAPGSDDSLLVKFNADQAMTGTLLETRQQAAPPATQIEHARACRDQLNDALIIDAPLMKNTRRTESVFRAATDRGNM